MHTFIFLLDLLMKWSTEVLTLKKYSEWLDSYNKLKYV